MADLPSYQELVRVGRDEVLARSARLTAEVLNRDGSDANALNNGMATTADEVVGQLARAQADVFLDTAEGKALDRLVFDRYGMLRKPAAPARGSFTFSTTILNPSTFTSPIGTQFSTPDGRLYVTTAPGTFLSGGTGPVYVAVRSVLVGLDQQLPAGSQINIISTITGAPTDLVAAVPLATAGAADEEGDDSLRDRARAFFTTARRGTLSALIEGAVSTPGVRNASAFEFVDSLGRPAGGAQVVVTDAYTDVLVDQSSNPPTYQAQSQVLALSVAANLNDYRAAGVYVAVKVAQVVLRQIQLGLTFTALVDPDLVALEARAAIVIYVNNLEPGETLTIAGLQAVLVLIPGLIVSGDEIISPPGDIVPEQLQVIRSNLSLVVANSISPVFALQGSSNPDTV